MKAVNKTLLNFNPVFGFIYLLVILSTTILLASPYYKFAFLPVACVLGLIILAKKPLLGYLLIIFLIPLDAYTSLTVRYQYLTLTKLIGFWLIVVISYYFLMKKKEMGLFIFKAPIWKWLWIFMIINLISALMSNYHSISFYSIRRLFVAYIFLALTLSIVSYRDLLKRIPLIIITSNAIASLLAIIGYVFHIPYFTIGLGKSVFALERATGLSGGPNTFAMAVLFSLPYIAYIFLTTEKARLKIFSVILLVINILAVIVSFSRSGALVLGLLAILHVIIYRRFFRPKNWGFVMLFLVAIISAIAIWAPSSYWSRIKSITQTSSDISIARRLSYTGIAWKSFKEHPILGTGPGSFPEVYAHSGTPYKYVSEDYRRAAHNVYLEILVGTGILGLASFLIILLASLKDIFRARKRLILKGPKNLLSLFDAYLLSFISLLVFFYMISLLYNKYLWMMIAMAYIMTALVEKIETASQEPDTPILSI
jgi:O-antigen ligase